MVDLPRFPGWFDSSDGAGALPLGLGHSQKLGGDFLREISIGQGVGLLAQRCQRLDLVGQSGRNAADFVIVAVLREFSDNSSRVSSTRFSAQVIAGSSSRPWWLLSFALALEPREASVRVDKTSLTCWRLPTAAPQSFGDVRRRASRVSSRRLSAAASGIEACRRSCCEPLVMQSLLAGVRRVDGDARSWHRPTTIGIDAIAMAGRLARPVRPGRRSDTG